MSDFHALTIQDITRETAQAVSITFGVPDALKEQFEFKAGQYVTLKTEIEGKEIRRAYSLCSTPQSGKLKVAVKEVEGGTFSVLANNKLTVGESLEVHPPEGKFFIETNADNNKDYAAFAAGSGITPVLSIVKTVLEQEPNSRFVLLYGNRTIEETIFHKELLELQLKYPERLFLEFVFSRKQESNSHFGRIENATVNYILKNKFKSHDFDQYFLCGPEEMIKGVSAILAENNIAEDKIKFELFTSSNDGAEIAEALDGVTQLKIMVDDEEFELTINQDKIVLDAALDNDIDVPYSCQGGICSSCIARVTEGTAVMRKNQILTDGEVAEGLILTCQALATSANLTVDYDDL